MDIHTLEDASVENLCIFAHYDPDDVVDDHVLRYIRSIGECGFAVVVVSTSKLSGRPLELLKRSCAEIILRDNIGYDFGSWSTGLARYKGRFSGNLLLANDSVYGPIGSLAVAVARLTARDADFYGMVKSRQFVPHLQSWFLLFRPQVWQHRAFNSIFRQQPLNASKQEIISRYELAATEQLHRAGFRSGSLYSADLLKFTPNPAHFLWRELLENYDVPFVKVGLLTHNPSQVGNVDEWRRVVAKRAPELVPLVNNHLARVARGHAAKGRATPTFASKIVTRFIRNDEFFGSRRLSLFSTANLQLFKLARRAFAVRRTLKHLFTTGNNAAADGGGQ